MGDPIEQLGGKFLLYVDTTGIPTWTKVEGQRKGKFDRKVDVVKAQHKDSFPWYRKVSAYKDWTFDFDGVWITDDSTGIQATGIKYLQSCYEELDEVSVDVQIVTPQYSEEAGVGSTYTGNVILAEFAIDGPHDNLITYTGKLEGNGAYTFDE